MGSQRCEENDGALPWTGCNLSKYCLSDTDHPVALDADPCGLDDIIVTMRQGAIISVNTDTPESELVGEVVDGDGRTERNGILALQRSPDGALVCIVSPAKIIVMTVTWDLVGEIEFDTDGTNASLSWRVDGAAVAAVVRDTSGAVHGFVVDRNISKHVKLHMSALNQSEIHFCSYVSWQPRVVGAISLAGPGNVVTFFERNGLHHSRHDFELLAADGHPAIRIMGAPPDIISWSCDSCMLAAVTSNDESPITPSESVDVYVRSNYK